MGLKLMPHIKGQHVSKEVFFILFITNGHRN